MDLSRLTWQIVVVVVAVLGAYVALSLAGVDTGQLVSVVSVLVGGGGVVAHQALRLDKQDKTLTKQNQTLATISNQTNGVLDQRIHDGATKAIVGVMRRVGYTIPDEPDDE